MKRILQYIARLSLPLSLIPVAMATAQACPTPNPTRDFVYNFYLQPDAAACYAVPLYASSGASSGGDPNSLYSQIYYGVSSEYQLVVLGYFPNSRFMSVSLNDSHSTVTPDPGTGSYYDSQIPPLYSVMKNPFVPGNHYTADQMYGFTVSLGGSLTQNPTAGCSTNGSTMLNLNATSIHSGLTWTGATPPEENFLLPARAPAHDNGAANVGGSVLIRDYMDYASKPQRPVVIVRQLSTGCAVPASTVSAIVSRTANAAWLDAAETNWHHEIYSLASISPTYSYPPETAYNQQTQWTRSPDWVGRDNSAAAYVSTLLPSDQLSNFLSGSTVMRVRFQLPTTPNIPCAPNSVPECSLTGSENVRYFSMEFSSSNLAASPPGSTSLWALDDTYFVVNPGDPARNVTLVVSATGQFPPEATAANYYTQFNLQPYLQSLNPFNSLVLRNFLPNATFDCSTFNVPNYTNENYVSNGVASGFMGAFVPTVDFVPLDSALFNSPATGTGRPNTCGDTPPAPALSYKSPRTPV